MYGILGFDGEYMTSAEIRAQLDADVADEARYIAAIDKIESRGICYSNQDFDVLSGAKHAIWRRGECQRLGLDPNCDAAKFWTVKRGELR